MHDRSSHQRRSLSKCVLRNFVKFTEKHLCQSLFFNKVADLRHEKRYKLVQVFKNERSKFFGRQPLKNFTWSIHDWFSQIFRRSSPLEVFLGICVQRICGKFSRKFTGEYPCRRVGSINLQSNFIETTLRHLNKMIFGGLLLSIEKNFDIVQYR